MNQCDGKLCAFFPASVTPPDGWVEDKAAIRHFDAVILLPKGVAFNATIFAIAVYNPKKQPIADSLADGIEDWEGRARDAKITDLPEFPRGAGKSAFARRVFEPASLTEQGYELQAVITSDGDKDGNEFIVTITLSANSKDALNVGTGLSCHLGQVLSAHPLSRMMRDA